MGDVMREATFSLAEANFAAGDFRYLSISWFFTNKLIFFFTDMVWIHLTGTRARVT